MDYDHDDYDSMKTICEKYNKAVENISRLWKGTSRPDTLRTRPSSSKFPVLCGLLVDQDIKSLKEYATNENRVAPYRSALDENRFHVFCDLIALKFHNESICLLFDGSMVVGHVFQLIGLPVIKVYFTRIKLGG